MARDGLAGAGLRPVMVPRVDFVSLGAAFGADFGVLVCVLDSFSVTLPDFDTVLAGVFTFLDAFAGVREPALFGEAAFFETVTRAEALRLAAARVFPADVFTGTGLTFFVVCLTCLIIFILSFAP
ncbi:MAG: hypothetical protein EXR08_01105 [Alphaproteobacteria bacterium]|nr:hypothetical protein [Alphaproteobacteria bacterium]